MGQPPRFTFPLPLAGEAGRGPAAAQPGKAPSRGKTLPQPLPQAGGEKREAAASLFPPPPLAGEAGRGPAAAQPGKAPSRGKLLLQSLPQARGKTMGQPPRFSLLSRLRGRQGWGPQRPRTPARSWRVERPSPNPSRKREGKRWGSRPAFSSSPACGGGREGVSGCEARQGPPRRKTFPQPLPQNEREDGGAAALLSSPPVCGGGREGASGCASRQGPAASKDPPPIPPASGRGNGGAGASLSSPPPLAGEAEWGPAAAPVETRQRPVAPKDPPPTLPQALPHAHIWHLICIGVWVCALGGGSDSLRLTGFEDWQEGLRDGRGRGVFRGPAGGPVVWGFA